MTTPTKKTASTKSARPSPKASSTAKKAQSSASQKPLADVAVEAPTPPSRQPKTGEQSNEAATKIGSVLALMQRDQGATLDELTQATGWLPHTARAAMTGLRKKGHPISRTKEGGVSRYRLAEVAA